MYYFIADVWGTVSDWFMVGVTALTAYYLYKTLQSQTDVQETQNKLFEIEKIRFAESIKPVLNFCQVLAGGGQIGQDGKHGTHAIKVLNDSKNDALDGFFLVDYIAPSITLVNPHETTFYLKSKNSFIVNFNLDSSVSDDNYLLLRFEFRDIANNKFTQNLNCKLHKGGGATTFESIAKLVT